MDQLFDSLGRELRYIEYKIRQHRAQSKKEKQNRHEKQNNHDDHHHRQHENNHHWPPENSYAPRDSRCDDASKAVECEEQTRTHKALNGGRRVTLTDKDRLEKTLKESTTVAAKILERTRGYEKSTDTSASIDPWSVPTQSNKSDYPTSCSWDSNNKHPKFISLPNAETSISVSTKEPVQQFDNMSTPANQEWPASAEQPNFGEGFDPFALATNEETDDLLGFNDINASNLTQQKPQSKNFKDTVTNFLGVDAAQILNVNDLISSPQSRNVIPNPYQKKNKILNELKKPDGIPLASPPIPTWTTDFSSPNNVETSMMQPIVFTSTSIQQTGPFANQPSQTSQNNNFF